MDNSVEDTKIIPTKRDCSVTLYKCSSMLSVVAILLSFAVFVRIETVARDSKTMDSKFTLQIQQIQDALRKMVSVHETEYYDIANGKRKVLD